LGGGKMKTTGLKLSEVVAMYEDDKTIELSLNDTKRSASEWFSNYSLEWLLKQTWEIKPKEVLITREKLKEAYNKIYPASSGLDPDAHFKSICKELGL
jgi:hypothetical protein